MILLMGLIETRVVFEFCWNWHIANTNTRLIETRVVFIKNLIDSI